jgi:hypothetical protein
MTKRIQEILDLNGLGGASEEPLRPSRARMQWKPDMENGPVPIKTQPSRFDLPKPSAEEMPTEMGQSDIDALIARIRAEEQQPPHKKNAARIADLKRQAMDLMRQSESAWVQYRADRLLPRLQG